MIRRLSGPVGFPVLGAVVITVLLLLGPDKIMDAYDIARMHQCYKADFRAMILAGEMPWWNPYTALGRPFLADVETATLYPPSWLVIPLGVTAGIITMIGLHLALAIGGMQKLGEHFEISPAFSRLAGVSFATSGALLGRIQGGQLHVFCVICLLPWLWWSTLQLQDKFTRKRLAQVSIWWAVGFLAGSPQILWCGMIVLSVLLIFRVQSPETFVMLFGKLCLAGVLAAGITALQLLPFIELVQQGNRPLNDVNFATVAGESLQGWLTLFAVPGSWVRPDGEFNLYCGAPVLIFALLAAFRFQQRNIRALTVAGVVAILLALGNGSFLLPCLAKWVPGFASVRYPSRYALSLAVILNLLAFWWLDRMFREKKIGRATLTIVLITHAAMLTGGLFLQSKIYRVPAVPANEVKLQADLQDEHLPRDGAPVRVALPSSLLRANVGAQAGISTLAGFNNPALTRTWTSLYIMSGKRPPNFHRAEVTNDIIGKLGAEQRFFNLSVVMTGKGNEVRFGPPPLPRAYLSFASSLAANWSSAVERIHRGHDFAREALVEQSSAQIVNPRADASGQVRILEFGRNRIVTDYQSNSPGILVLAEAWYPGWTAKIGESEKLPTFPVNGWMRGTLISPGAHRVVFEYHPTRWWPGVVVSALSIFIALGLVRHSFTPPQNPLET